MNMKPELLIGLISILLLNQSVSAENYTIPKTFTDGETLTANDLNAENAALKIAIDDNNSGVSANTNNININAGGISSNTLSINNIPAASKISYINNNDGANCHTLTNSVVNTANTTIIAPSDGFVFVTFSAYTYITHTYDAYSRMKVGLSDASATGTTESVRLLSELITSPTGTYYGSINMQQVYSVTSGSSNTYYANSLMQFGVGKLCHFNLTAIFIPN